MTEQTNENQEVETQEETTQAQDIVYFISYYSSQGMGNTEVLITGGFIGSLNLVADIENMIAEESGLSNVKVINFIPLREEPVEA